MYPVTVIVPTYNRALFLQECIEAILSQTYQQFDLLIVDDGSEDNTPSIIAQYQNNPKIQGRFGYIRQENKGVSCARNTGISHARGIYLAFCDSDDLWLPNKLKTQMEFFQNNPDATVCYTDEIWIRNGLRINPCKHHQKISGWIFEKSLELCIVSPSSVMMHRRFFEIAGYFDESLPACEDYDLWLRASLKMSFFFIEKALIIKRGGHDDQLSQKYWGMDRFRVDAIIRCLKNADITAEQRKKAAIILKKKCTILANGAAKRGDMENACLYRQYIHEWAEPYLTD